MNTYIAGEGPADAKLMVVGEAPGEQEVLQGRPFVGPAGQVFNKLLHEAGIDRGEIFITNVSGYRPPGNKFDLLHTIGVDVEKEKEKLFNTIRDIKPNAILALGDKALQTLTGYKGIKTYRGSILRSKLTSTKIIPTIHPAAFLHGDGKGAYPYSALAYVKLDYARAYEESQTPAYTVPERRLEIAGSSADVYRFFRTYENKDTAASDIESIKCVPSCISFAFNKHHAMSIPLLPGLTDTLFPRSDIAQCWRMIDEVLRKKKIIGQNFKYDQHKLSNPCGFPIVQLYADTAMMAHVLYPEFPKAIEFLCSIFTREPYYKSEYKDWVPGKDSYRQVLSYNAKDSAVTFELWEELDKELREDGLADFYYTFFHHAHELYYHIENCGMAMDESVRSELVKKYTLEAANLQNKINEIAGRHLNVNSSPQMNKFLYQFLDLPRRKDATEDTIVALMNNAIKADKDQWKRAVLRNVLALRKTKKTKGTYLLARTDFDGRMRTQYNINGTENGRTSTTKVDSKKRINRPIFTGLAFQTLTKHGQVGTDLRKMFVPDPGCAFLQMDLSQAEARIVAVLSEDWNLIEKFNSGVDVHSELSAIINGKTWDGKRAKEDDRFIGKTGRHSYNYGVKKDTFMLQVNTDAEKFGIDLKISSWKANKILEAVRSAHPNVEKVFHAEIERKLQEDRTLYNPFGRRRVFYDRWGHSLIQEGLAFIPQSTVRDQMLKCMLAFVQKFPELKKKICVEAHDAMVVICPLELIDTVARWLIQWNKDNLIDFTRCSLSRDYKLHIPCDIEVGEENYKELKKYKIAA